METALYIVFFVSCLVLVIAVLLQPGKTDAGALFTSGISSAALNPRGTQSVLSKLTIGAATVFMLSALLLSLPAITGSRSVLDTEGVEDAAATETNANVNADTGTTNAAAPVNANPGGAANVGQGGGESETAPEKDAGAKPESK